MNLQEKKTFKFKTNINCSGCIAKIDPVLDKTEGIEEWSIDTENPNKVLTIVSDKITEKEIVDVVTTNGFKIESIN